MTLEQKIGAMLMLGWEGDNPTDDTTVCAKNREIVKDMGAGGIILMGRNIRHDDLTVTVNTINELQALAREPLLVNVDQEGGMVARFQDGVTVMPSAMTLGATRRPDLAYKACRACAEELIALGVNYNFAPCVDVNNNPDNPIIGTRSYGESPDLVADFGAQAVRGFQDAGLVACAKHFPGHGDTAVDSHLALPSIPYPRERLEAVELKPFRAAIAAGVSSIMTTHILFPALDPDLPSTLSPKIINGLLRAEMGYDGVIVTDSMEMKGIAANWSVPEASVLAIEAGVDLILIPHTLDTMRESREAIIKAVKDGRISESRIDESVTRIMAMKRRYDLGRRRFADPNALGRFLRTPEHLTIQRQTAECGVTLVRNEDQTIPLKLGVGEKLLVTGMHFTVPRLASALRAHFDSVEALELKGDRDEVMKQLPAAASGAGAIVVATCPVEPWRQATDQALQADVVKSLYALGKKLVVVAVRDPYDLRRFPDVRTYICTYGYREGSLEAAASLIAGAIPPRGMLPVTID